VILAFHGAEAVEGVTRQLISSMRSSI